MKQSDIYEDVHGRRPWKRVPVAAVAVAVVRLMKAAQASVFIFIFIIKTTRLSETNRR